MVRRVADGAVLPLALDRADEVPLHKQIYDQIRDLILTRRLHAGGRLPSTRTLAKELGVSRNTVSVAFDQLLAEGYLEGKVGAGSFVSSELPEDALQTRLGAETVPDVHATPRRRGLSERGARLSGLRRNISRPRIPAFATGLPDLDGFPFDIWSRLMSKAWRRPPLELLANTEPGGYTPLRRAIAAYLETARGVRCAPEQVIVVSGAQQAIGIASHVLLDEGDVALMEEPGYPGVRGALIAAGIRTKFVPVDSEGFDVDAAERIAPEAKLACIAPSHQYPLGVTMSLARRLKLLDWAQRRDGWILEDDYDSEYRYAGRPLNALQGLDKDGRVVYIGSFSKVMFPSLRIGYLVVPPDLADPFRLARAALDDHPSTVAQPALTAFIEDGHFATHLRRMRKRYADRQAALVEAATTYLDGMLRIEPSDAGMHLLARFEAELAARMDDREAQQRCADEGVSVSALHTYYADPARYDADMTAQDGIGPALLLGYAAVPEDRIPHYVRKMARALEA